MHHRGVIAPAEPPPDFRQRAGRQALGEIHRHLAGAGDLARATGGDHVGGLDPLLDRKQLGRVARPGVEQVVRTRITVAGNEEQQLAAVLAEIDEIDELAGKAFRQRPIKLRGGQVGGDENMYRELLSDFIDGLPKRLRAIQNFYVEKDLVELSRTAHNLSGIAANLGASQLSDCAKKLDKQSVEGYTESLHGLIQEIQLVVGGLLEFSSNFLAEKQVNVESV